MRLACPYPGHPFLKLLDLPRPNRRGFPRDSYDVAHNHRDAARTSPQRETALRARNTYPRRAAWLHRGDIACPWVQRRYVSRPGPRRARYGAPPDYEGGQAEDPVCPHEDHGRRPEGDQRLIELGPGTRRCGRRWIPAWGCPAGASRGPGPCSAISPEGAGASHVILVLHVQTAQQDTDATPTRHAAMRGTLDEGSRLFEARGLDVEWPAQDTFAFLPLTAAPLSRLRPPPRAWPT